VRFNEAGDGEVDENYWVQAAAEQAAGRNGTEGDEGGQLPSERKLTFANCSGNRPDRWCCAIQYPILPR
jgi:condensin complex subunit 2